jgi:hypothetical protein
MKKLYFVLVLMLVSVVSIAQKNKFELWREESPNSTFREYVGKENVRYIDRGIPYTIVHYNGSYDVSSYLSPVSKAGRVKWLIIGSYNEGCTVVFIYWNPTQFPQFMIETANGCDDIDSGGGCDNEGCCGKAIGKNVIFRQKNKKTGKVSRFIIFEDYGKLQEKINLLSN